MLERSFRMEYRQIEFSGDGFSVRGPHTAMYKLKRGDSIDEFLADGIPGRRVSNALGKNEVYIKHVIPIPVGDLMKANHGDCVGGIKITNQYHTEVTEVFSGDIEKGKKMMVIEAEEVEKGILSVEGWDKLRVEVYADRNPCTYIGRDINMVTYNPK